MKRISHQRFMKTIREHYRTNKRSMPWCSRRSAYRVFVSEIMLQQTQVSRVMKKYPAFINRFPSFSTLANVPTRDVLIEWQGLGYNRRALNMQRAAQYIMNKHGGKLPRNVEELIHLPGIGHATASSICAFAYNVPVVFIETNIRRVFIHHFFAHAHDVNDKDILPLIKKTLDRTNSREWYYALMDYGAWLATQTENPNRKSKHYTKQTTFEGSNREVRGIIVRALSLRSRSRKELETACNDDPRAEKIIHDLVLEGFIRKRKKYSLA